MSLPELRDYRPTILEPDDFDAFWSGTISEARAAAARSGTVPTLQGVEDAHVTELIVEDLTFPGFAGEPVRAWVTRPKRALSQRLPAVVEYLGYGGGRGLPGDRARWALAGYVHVVMDTRGQGSDWAGGDTPDPHGSAPHIGGWMTLGILDPHDHFYRRVYTDAVRLLDAVREFAFVDSERVAVTGVSQGGGIAIAAAALTRVAAVMPDVAFLADWKHGADIATDGPYKELVRYLAVHRDRAERAWTTASYLDAVNFARRMHAPALFSVALMDPVVPPRTTFAAFNATASEDTDIEVYPYNGHEGGGSAHWMKQAAFLVSRL